MYSERSNGSGSGGGSARSNASRGRGAAGRKRGAARAVPASRFILYVEGPGDSDILRSWARRVSSDLERVIAACSVILGGRQPARAVEHFRRARETDADARGLCVLDRDDETESVGLRETGLDFFTWPRRHIESYLLVPSAIGRHARRDRDSQRIEKLIERLGGEAGMDRGTGGVDAKRMLAPRGPLARELGSAISPAGVARAMRHDEIHSEVHTLLGRVSDAAGLRVCSEPVVVRRVERGSKRER